MFVWPQKLLKNCLIKGILKQTIKAFPTDPADQMPTKQFASV